MRPSSYRFSDYRLAAYVVFAAVVVGGATFAYDRLTAPSSKLEADRAPAAAEGVRQIPIARTTAADIGDPDSKLTPVYPTSPGKDLPVKEAPVIQPVKPVVAATTGSAPASTTGSANAQAPAVASVQPAPTVPAPANAQPVSTTTGSAVDQAAPPAQTQIRSQATNSCDVAACASAYRSFRQSDCSYQPFEGPRRYCEGAPGANAPNGHIASQPAAQSVSRGRYEDELRDAERTVRRLPPPPGVGNDDEDSVVVLHAPDRSRYELRRNWFNDQQD